MTFYNKDDMLTSGNYFGLKTEKVFSSDNISIIDSLYQSNTILSAHEHDTFHLVLVKNGMYEECFLKQKRILEKGDLIIHPGFQQHENKIFKNNTSVLNIEVSSEWMNKFGFDNNYNIENRIFQGAITKHLHDLLCIYANNFHCNYIEIESLFIDIFNNIKQQTIKLNGTNRIISRVKSFLQEADVYSNHSLQDIGINLNIHPIYLARLFKEKTGMTIGEYTRKIKIDKACKDLIYSKNTITEIAISSGFYDQSHFIRVFKQNFGTSPLKFRKQFSD